MKAAPAVPRSGTCQPLTSCQAHQPAAPRNYCSPQSSFLVWSFLPCSLWDVGQLFLAGLSPCWTPGGWDGAQGWGQVPWAMSGLCLASLRFTLGISPKVSFTQFILCLLFQVSLLQAWEGLGDTSFYSNTRTGSP